MFREGLKGGLKLLKGVGFLSEATRSYFRAFTIGMVLSLSFKGDLDRGGGALV